MSGGQYQGALPETHWSASSQPRLPEQTLNPSPDLSNSFFPRKPSLLCVSRRADLSGFMEHDNALMPLQIPRLTDIVQACLLHQSDHVPALAGTDFQGSDGPRFHSPL